MVQVRKQFAGADSYGHEWLEPGAVVEMPAAEALDLLSIRDGGFTLVEDTTQPGTPEPEGDPVVPVPPEDVPEPETTPEAEPESEPERTEIDEAPARRKPGRPRKTEPVEE